MTAGLRARCRTMLPTARLSRSDKSFCGAFRYVVSVYRNCVDRVNPFAESSLLAPAIGTPLYLIAVFGGKWLMKDREAFEPTEWMIVYNLYQTVLNMVRSHSR